MIGVQVKLFAVLRERAGVAEMALELPEGAVVADAVAAVSARFPALIPLLASTAAAVNLARALPNQRLAAGDEVALLPPVSGG